MSRRDYIALAKIIKRHREQTTGNGQLAIERLTLEIADYLQTDSPAFDRTRFLRATWRND